MGKLQQASPPLNESDGLRAYIATCERDTASPTRENASQIFNMLAHAEEIAEKLRGRGADMRPEFSRIDSLHERITRNAAMLVESVGGVAAYAALRNSLRPGSTRPAWQLDHRLAARRAKRLRTAAITLIAIAALSGSAWWFRDTLLPDDPAGVAANAAMLALSNGAAPRTALEKIDAGLVITPTNALLLTWRNVLLKDIDATTAQEADTRARAVMGDREFLIQRATLHVQLNRADAALADANALLVLDSQMAEAYYLRASGYELKNELKAAVADLEKCASLAEAQNNESLFATTRIRLGNLMQRIGY